MWCSQPSMSIVHSQKSKPYILYCIAFIHFYSASHNMSLSEALRTIAALTVAFYTPKLYRQLRVKDLPKVPYVAARAGFEPATLQPSKGWRVALYQCAT